MISLQYLLAQQSTTCVSPHQTPDLIGGQLSRGNRDLTYDPLAYDRARLG